jgi:hypothetical protein
MENNTEEKKSPQIKQLKVVVTDMEIEFAERNDSKHCMVTDAIKRDYGKRFTNIVTDKEFTAFTERKTGRRYKFPLTPLAIASLLNFDEGNKVTPFTCILRRPIVRERRKRISTAKAPNAEKLPLLEGSSQFGARGTMSGLKNKERRIKRGIDRVFGRRIFKPELDALRERLGVGIA